MTSFKLLFVLSIASRSFLAATPGLPAILSAPFASSPLAAPTGNRVAWLENEQGKRNLYVFAAPNGKAQRVTHFDEDDGQEIADVVWAPDASYLLFARGGDFETGGDNPNPAIRAAAPNQEIWYVTADGSGVRKLTEGNSPAISPKGDVVAFLRDNQIFTMRSSGEEITLAVKQKGRPSHLRWSPDGEQLAFVLSRPRHSLIGVYAPASKQLRFLDPSSDYDDEPVWSPDGSRLASIRVPSVSPRLGPGPRRDGPPWSVRVTEWAAGKSWEAFRASSGMGSVFHAVDAANQLIWADGDRLVFPWERSGWCHLYSASASAAEPRGKPLELTPGDGEVEQVAASPDRKTIYYSSNIGDIDARHLWKTAAAGGTPIALTSGESIDWAPTPLAGDSSLFFLSASYREKSHTMLRSGDGKLQAVAPELVPAAFPSESFVKPESVIIQSADGMPIHCQLFLPAHSATGQKHPALAFFHGGSRRQMLLGFHYMYYYSNAYAMNQYLAGLGYVVLSVNYRSGTGYGLNFREALKYGAEGGSEYNDVAGAGLYLKTRPDVDPARVGLWGGSYGGYLTAMGLARASDLFAAGVDFHGVHDWSSLRETFPPEGGDPEALQAYREGMRVAFDSSPMASVDGWKSPVLLIHGDDDRNVSFAQTVILAEALRKRHVEFEELIFPNEIHDFLRADHWLAAYQATADFFNRHLKP